MWGPPDARPVGQTGQALSPARCQPTRKRRGERGQGSDPPAHHCSPCPLPSAAAFPSPVFSPRSGGSLGVRWGRGPLSTCSLGQRLRQPHAWAGPAGRRCGNNGLQPSASGGDLLASPVLQRVQPEQPRGGPPRLPSRLLQQPPQSLRAAHRPDPPAGHSPSSPPLLRVPAVVLQRPPAAAAGLGPLSWLVATGHLPPWHSLPPLHRRLPLSPQGPVLLGREPDDHPQPGHRLWADPLPDGRPGLQGWAGGGGPRPVLRGHFQCTCGQEGGGSW